MSLDCRIHFARLPCQMSSSPLNRVFQAYFDLFAYTLNALQFFVTRLRLADLQILGIWFCHLTLGG